jgi:superfamily II DNA or RNA helicase
MEELLTLIIQNIKRFEESMKFRKGQKPFYDKIIEGLKNDWTTMFIKGPTGMGKTFLEAVLAAAIIGDSNIKVLLLTSKITLLKQIQGEFVKFVGFLSTGLFGGGFKDHHQQVTIMTYASYQRQKESFVKQFKVLLLDEGHRGLGKLTKVQLEKQKEFSILIGFTASDEYSKEKSLTQFLVNKAHELSIGEAVELGMLSNIKVMFASVDIEISGQAENETKGDYENRISSDIIRQGGNIATARLYKRVFAKRNLRGICLVLTTNQGNDLVTQFANENIKAELIHSGLIRTEREDMFTRFRNNEFTVLIGMGIIKEGFNDPAVSVAITTYPVGSRVDMTQFPGRAERIDDDNPDKVAYVVNLAYKNKKQLFYTNVLDGKSEILQKQSCRKKLDIISRSEMRSAIARNPESFITSVAVDEEEVMEIMRSYESVEFLSYEELKKEVMEIMRSRLRLHMWKSKNSTQIGQLISGSIKISILTKTSLV